MKLVDRYFNMRMKNIFVERVEYKVVETFDRYLAHRYRTSCYWYSEYALLGLNENDLLVRGDITLDGDCIWCNGGYNHGWVELSYNGKIYVFDSRCIGLVPKEEWYRRFKPENLIKKTQKEILELVLKPENCEQMADYYHIKANIGEDDKYYFEKPLRNAKIRIINGKIERAIVSRNTFGKN